MAVRIRLQRKGRKRFPYFHIVIADQRSPRDGKYIERIGSYNPNTNPATIDIDFDKTLDWYKKGAQPSDTVRAILSYKGVLYKHHLDKGVTNGAFSQDEADKKFEKWLGEKEGKVQAKVDRLATESAEDRKQRLAAEKEVNKAKAEAIAAKNTPEPEVAPEAEAGESAVAEAAAEAPAEETAQPAEVKAEVEAAQEAPDTKEAKNEVKEAEAKAEEKVEEKKEEPKAEAATEAPAEEKKEEPKAEEAAAEEKKEGDA